VAVIEAGSSAACLSPAHDEADVWRFGENAINQNGIKDQGAFTGNEGERVDWSVRKSRLLRFSLENFPAKTNTARRLPPRRAFIWRTIAIACRAS
jgi:hypothetical protein